MIKTYYLSTCVPTHKVIQNKNKYIAHNSIKSTDTNSALFPDISALAHWQ